MGKNIYQKKDIVKGVKHELQNAQLIFSTDMTKLNINQLKELRKGMPEGSKAMCIKNRLMRRAAAGTPWAAAEPAAKGTHNMWIIVNSDVKGTIEHFTKWQKVSKREEGIKAGVIEGQLYDDKGVIAIGKLPTKKELYAQIAGAVKAVPTKLAATLKEASGQKMARAVKLAVSPDA